MTFSPRAIEAAAEAMREGIAQDNPLKTARDALTAALAVDGVALQGWQPMDSAPRDGTEILWASLDTTTVIKWPEYRECFEEGGWWMPLPSPPAASDREERPSPAQEPR